MQDLIAPALAGVLVLVLAVALVRARSGAERAVEEARAEAHAEAAALREQLAAIERRLGRPTSPAAETSYVITGLGDKRDEQPAAGERVDSALFADLVLRETVVKAAALVHGVRRALEPETRNRIRFEMKREVKRARKQRRADTREARRDWEARRRAAQDAESAA